MLVNVGVKMSEMRDKNRGETQVARKCSTLRIRGIEAGATARIDSSLLPLLFPRQSRRWPDISVPADDFALSTGTSV